MAGRPGRTLPQPAAPARKGKAAPARKSARPTVLGRVFARPGVIVAGASFAAVMTGIVANALILQKGHHPSPLFSPAATETAQPAPVPLPPPAPRQVLEQPAAPAEAPAPAPAAPVEDVPAAPAPTARPATATPHAAAKKPAAHPAATHVAATAHKEAAAPGHKAAPAVHKDPIAQLLGKAQ